MESICDLCEKQILYSSQYIFEHINYLIHKYTTTNCSKSLAKIETFARMDNSIKHYITFVHPHIKFNIDINIYVPQFPMHDIYLLQQPKNNYTIKCDFCKLNSCSYHVKTGSFTFYKCKNCNSNTVLCGWCNVKNNDMCNNPLCIDVSLYINSESESDTIYTIID